MQREPSRAMRAGLSERELEVLLALARGGSNREIADDLGISAKTVGHHVQNVYAKAGVRSRAAATRWAFEHELVHLRRLTHVERTLPAARVYAGGAGSRPLGLTMMATRAASCHCGQLRLEVEGDPFVVSICNCLACQRRTGSAFGMQAAFKAGQVEVSGRFNDFSRISDEADRKEHLFHFCPQCGSQVFCTEPTEPDLIVVSVGAFADPSFPWPTESGYDSRRHPWVRLPHSGSVYAPELWEPVRPVYAAGRYAEAAEMGLALIAERPDQAYLFYNVACCESLAGRTGDAIEHLGRAVEMWDGCREMARHDSDFDPIRGDAGFMSLIDD